jgi:uncharacterized membrane protein (UPF0127 family)
MAAWLRLPIRSRTFAVVGIVAAIACYAFWSYRELAPARSTISFVVPGGTLRVETATTPQERAAGLAGRAAPAADGLLLEWPAAGRHPIWMKDMRFSLDLVWLDEDDRILAVVNRAPPCSNRPCPLYEPAGTETARTVLELRGGEAAARGLVVGARLRRTSTPSSVAR